MLMGITAVRHRTFTTNTYYLTTTGLEVKRFGNKYFLGGCYFLKNVGFDGLEGFNEYKLKRESAVHFVGDYRGGR